jgi:hypothetical protein
VVRSVLIRRINGEWLPVVGVLSICSCARCGALLSRADQTSIHLRPAILAPAVHFKVKISQSDSSAPLTGTTLGPVASDGAQQAAENELCPAAPRFGEARRGFAFLRKAVG